MPLYSSGREAVYSRSHDSRAHIQHDCAHYKEFDASEWFAVASPESILRLAENGWGGEHAAGELARYFAQGDDEIATIFQYVMYLRHGGLQAGFRCEVDPVSALEWLAFVRPNVLAEIRKHDPSWK